MTPDTEELCGKWMPRKRTPCARKPGHQSECRTAEAMADNRQRTADRRRGVVPDPAARRRWARTHRLSRYGLTPEKFDRLLEVQGNSCGMCHGPFAAGGPIFVDHDHACCPGGRASCGKCVRGLLCLSCNTALGHIERKSELACAYLANPPGLLTVAA
jgi:Recombination endonuclease VII